MSKKAWALALLLALLLVFGCSSGKNYGRTVYSFSQMLERQDEFVGRSVQVKATVKQGFDECSSTKCTSKDPCCKQCKSRLYISGDSDVKIATDKYCIGNNCALVCPLMPNQTYAFKGTIQLDSLRYYVFLADYADGKKI